MRRGCCRARSTEQQGRIDDGLQRLNATVTTLTQITKEKTGELDAVVRELATNAALHKEEAAAAVADLHTKAQDKNRAQDERAEALAAEAEETRRAVMHEIAQVSGAAEASAAALRERVEGTATQFGLACERMEAKFVEKNAAQDTRVEKLAGTCKLLSGARARVRLCS
jgi:polyhydroxyalkanoate synthesis regulator phasin